MLCEVVDMGYGGAQRKRRVFIHFAVCKAEFAFGDINTDDREALGNISLIQLKLHSFS